MPKQNKILAENQILVSVLKKKQKTKQLYWPGPNYISVIKHFFFNIFCYKRRSSKPTLSLKTAINVAISLLLVCE